LARKGHYCFYAKKFLPPKNKPTGKRRQFNNRLMRKERICEEESGNNEINVNNGVGR
jgi:hypothetical protein